MNPIIHAYYTSDLFGKGIFLSLLLLSIATWTIFFKKFIAQKNIQRVGIVFQSLFKKKSSNPLSIEVYESHPYANLYQILKKTTIELLGKNKTVIKKENMTLSVSDIHLIESYLINVVSTETKKMEGNLFILSTVVSLAPFLGLLGTVWGILLTFNELQTTISINSNTTIMGGLAMALGTTVVGLLVAIPALISYNYLRSAITQLSGDLEEFSHLLLSAVELQYRQVEIS
ncbi:MAG: MotA/TolQ/ExbB proton channel family protein [Chlamydiales bacterium]